MTKSDVLYSVGLLVNLLLFGLMGLLGQGVRAVVGLKSAATLSAGTPTRQSQFNAAYFFLSLMMGFIAGVLAGLGLMAAGTDPTTVHPDLKTLLGVAAAGYAGADFVENAFTRLIPGMTPPAMSAPPAPLNSLPAVPSPPAAPPLPSPMDEAPPPNTPPATVPVRLAVSGADPNTVALKMDDRAIDVDANGFAELILETGMAHTVIASGTAAGNVVSGQITILVSPDDLDKAYELALS